MSGQEAGLGLLASAEAGHSSGGHADRRTKEEAHVDAIFVANLFLEQGRVDAVHERPAQGQQVAQQHLRVVAWQLGRLSAIRDGHECHPCHAAHRRQDQQRNPAISHGAWGAREWGVASCGDGPHEHDEKLGDAHGLNAQQHAQDEREEPCGSSQVLGIRL